MFLFVDPNAAAAHMGTVLEVSTPRTLKFTVLRRGYLVALCNDDGMGIDDRVVRCWSPSAHIEGELRFTKIPA